MATDAPLTFYSSLDEIYVEGSLLAQGKRWDDLASSFKAEYGHAPTHVVRAPGRINLIGEHIDYCLFGVMPAAVEFDTLIAFSTQAPSASLNQAKAEGEQCSVSLSNVDRRWKRVSISAQLGSPDGTEEERWDIGLVEERLDGWDGYVRAALACVLENFFPSQPDTLPPHLNLMVSGNIPPGSGLSSSAALIVATLLALLVAYDIVPAQTVTNAQLVRLACDAELRLGLKNGGMDQSASVLGRPGAGLYISFWPALGVEAVKLPTVRTEKGDEQLVMVVANSLETHSLAEDAKRQYNLRVVETLVAGRLLWHGLGLDKKPGVEKTITASPHRPTLREVLARHMDEAHESTMSSTDLERALEEMLVEVERVLGDDERLKKEGFLIPEMAARSGMSEDDFVKTYMTHIEVEADTFHIYNRAKHVYSESLRVLQFRRIALAATSSGASLSDSGLVPEQPAHQLGRLMDESHASGRDVGDISVPAVDRLVELCKEAGAIGSRMSGGGWGGCTVSLIPASRERAFIEHITSPQTGYDKYAGIAEGEMRDIVFKSVPGSGAGVMKL